MPRTSTKTEAEKAKEAEAKRVKLKELAAKRLEKALGAIRQLEALASYKPSEAQRDYVAGQIAKATEQLHSRWSGTKAAVSEVKIPD